MKSLFSRYFRNMKIFLCFILVFNCAALFLVGHGHSYQLNPVSVVLNNNDLYVTTALIPEAGFMENIVEGMRKEITFYVDLFRVWKIWPDEFVRGKKILRVIKSDPIKREYSVISITDNVSIEKRFKDMDSMLSWALNITDLKLTGTKDLETGRYFVKVTVESNTKKLPPVIGYFLFFVSGKEFSVSRNSIEFNIPKEPDK